MNVMSLKENFTVHAILFFSVLNTVLSMSYCTEPVKLQLADSLCTINLVLIGAVALSKQMPQQLCVCYNDAFRKIYQL